MAVVHDFVEHEDSFFAANIKQLIDNIDRHVNASTEAAGVGEKDLHGGRG
jgi:hypothetical protein